MTKIRIAVLSQPCAQLIVIRDLLAQHADFDPAFFATPAGAETGLRRTEFSVIVVILPRFALPHVERILQIHQRFRHSLLCLLAAEIDDDARFRFVGNRRIVVLNSSNELSDLPEIMRRLLAETATPRRHPRTRRAEKIELTDVRGRVIFGRFIDFGRMGAKLQISATHLNRNDRIQLSYLSSTLDRQRRIEAIVVWQNADLSQRMLGSRTIGIQFIAVA